MGIKIFSRWFGVLENGNDAGICVYHFQDEFLKNLETLRVKVAPVLNELAYSDMKCIKPVISTTFPQTDYDASYYHTGMYAVSDELEKNFIDLYARWEDSQVLALYDSDPRCQDVQNIIDENCLVLETADERFYISEQGVCCDATDTGYAYGSISPSFILTAMTCKNLCIPHLFLSNP